MVSRSVGVQSSRECGPEVAAFYQCQREFGFIGRMCNACQTARTLMDKCLDRESAGRRRRNSEAARERMARFRQEQKQEEY